MAPDGLYELAFIIEPAIAESVLPDCMNKIEEILGRHEAKTSYSETPRLRNLAYTIEKANGGKRSKYKQGHFGWVRFESSGASIEDIGKEVNALSFVIRMLLIHAPKKDVVPVRARPRRMKEEVGGAKPTEADIEKEVDNLIASTQVA